MNNNKEIKMSDKLNGNQVRAYILNVMNSIQEIREQTNSLRKNSLILEMYKEQLDESNASLCDLNSLMGDIIGYTIADDVWERQNVTI